MKTIFDLAGQTRYPGRGIVLGKSEDGKSAIVCYFIMGRSENSRNRVFVREGDDLRAKAYDESKVEDPSLIHYYPLRTNGILTVVSNGDQTDTIMKNIIVPYGALRSRFFEPDAPHFTPRISGIVDPAGLPRFTLSILKTEDGEICQRQFFEYDDIPAGEGRFIHTYMGDGNPLPSFAGEPEKGALPGNIDDITNNLWAALDADNKISLYVRAIDLKTRTYEDRLINRQEA